VLAQNRFEVLAVDEFEYQERFVLLTALIEQTDQVGMAQVGDEATLAAKAFLQLMVAVQSRVQAFDGDLAIEDGVVGTPNGGHASATDQSVDAISTAEHAFRGAHLSRR
jgi:hypothetical protein